MDVDLPGAEPPSDAAPEGLLDPRRLVVFAEVARRGSLAAAAQSLGWTQPAVAQHVRRLERDTRAELVVRSPRGIVLTEAGRTLAQHAFAVTAQLRMAREELAALADLRMGRVRLAAFPSAFATFVPSALAALKESAPGLDVRLVEAEPPEARQLLANGDADLAVTFSYDHLPDERPNGQPPVTRPLFDDPMLLVLPRDHRLAGVSSPALADASDEKWVAGCPRCRAHLIAAAADEGFVPDIRHSTDDYVVTQTLVATGLGVALLPGLAIEAAKDPRVTLVEPAGRMVRRVALDLPAGLPSSRATAAVTGALLDAAKSRS